MRNGNRMPSNSEHLIVLLSVFPAHLTRRVLMLSIAVGSARRLATSASQYATSMLMTKDTAIAVCDWHISIDLLVYLLFVYFLQLLSAARFIRERRMSKHHIVALGSSFASGTRHSRYRRQDSTAIVKQLRPSTCQQAEC
ncbi:hypothetical protein MRB53_037280 [Persea americana]|nr:hypothetical protein MRB53_037280 [Persea americana]